VLKTFVKISEILTHFPLSKVSKEPKEIYLPKAEKIFKFEFFVAIATVDLIR